MYATFTTIYANYANIMDATFSPLGAYGHIESISIEVW